MENKLLYEGKAKKIFSTENPDELLVYYKDDATAGNGAKKGTIADKGILNNKITNFFFGLLEKEGIKHHLIGICLITGFGNYPWINYPRQRLWSA